MINLTSSNPSKQEKQRSYKPYLHQQFYDRLNDQYIIITNPFLLTRDTKQLVAYRSIKGGPEYVISLNVFNKVTDNQFDFEVCNNPEEIYTVVNRFDKAIELLKEVQENGCEDLKLFDKIKNFLEKI